MINVIFISIIQNIMISSNWKKIISNLKVKSTLVHYFNK